MFFLPTPESMRICGLPIAPALKITSRRALTVCGRPFLTIFTAKARLVLEFISTLVTWPYIAICRFSLFLTGLKKALAVEHLEPLLIVPGKYF